MTHVAQTPHRYRIERKPNILQASLAHFLFRVISRDVGEFV